MINNFMGRIPVIRKAFLVILTGTSILSVPAAAQAPTGAATAQFQQAAEAMRAGDFDAAAAGFAAVVRVSPTFAEAHFNLGLVNEERGRYDDAIKNFEKALVLKPHLHGANLFLGIT